MTASLAAALDDACRAFSGRLAVQDARESLTYAAVSSRAQAIAEALMAGQVNADEPVVVVVGNRAADFASFLGIWRAGCVAVPSHCAAPRAVLDALIERTGARFVVDGAEGEASGEASFAQRGTVRRLDRGAPPPPRELLRGAALVMFTSGSTGLPKGAVISHRALSGKLAANDGYLHFGPESRTLLALQITFSFGVWVSLLTLTRGGSLFALEKFDAERALDAIARHAIERAALVPTMLRAILALGEHDPAKLAMLREPCSLRLLMTGGESLGARLCAQARSVFPTATLVDIYGLTETATSDFVLQGGDLDAHAGCIGRPAPGVEFRIAGAGGARGETGELQIRTPYAMNGYLDAPELTRAAFAGGYFRTGDLARETAPGVVELIGRAKEIISRGGSKVAPLEVEQALLQHPDVAQALVTGVPDAQLGESIHALVVARPGSQPSAAALRAWAATRMEKYKLPDVWHFGTELPLGRTGKVDRGSLRERIVSGSIAGLVNPETGGRA